MASIGSDKGVFEKIMEKVPAWVFSFSILGTLLLILISIYLEKPFKLAGWEFGAIVVEKQIYVTNENSVPVGTIVASVLSPTDFLKYYGSNWVVADGRQVGTDTKYYELVGKREIPDIRGRFLRGLDLKAGIDPQMDRKAGDHQDDSTKIPDSFVLSQGKHVHILEIANVVTTKHAHFDGGSSFWTRESPHHTDEVKFKVPINESGTHMHTLSGGDAETRPKNISVYFYIKVDDKVNNPASGTSKK